MDKSSHPRVSYILTTKNRADLLDRTLQNVREYITINDELIIIDGGSTDHTEDVVLKHNDIITVFRSEPDYGESHGFNKAILNASGRYIKLLTDDDYIYPDAMRTAIAVLEKHPEIDALLAGGEAYVLNPDTNEERLVTYLRLPPSRYLMDDIINIFTYCQCGLGLVLTRDVISRVGLFDTSFHAVDTDYMGRLFAHSVVFKYLDVKLFRHIAHPSSGQNNWELCRRDRIRTLIRNQAFDTAFSYRVFDLKSIAEVLGISRLPGSYSFMLIVSFLLRLRRCLLGRFFIVILSAFPYIVKLLSDILCVLRAKARGALRLLFRYSKTSEKTVIEEPTWDGTLR